MAARKRSWADLTDDTGFALTAAYETGVGYWESLIADDCFDATGLDYSKAAQESQRHRRILLQRFQTAARQIVAMGSFP